MASKLAEISVIISSLKGDTINPMERPLYNLPLKSNRFRTYVATSSFSRYLYGMASKPINAPYAAIAIAALVSVSPPFFDNNSQ
eukprot:gnl/Chilomastix_caulleri/1442.p3 GENE.gnl/Chilomastix_caulleri/1442~~gnl/Chilomastix_caulleri/1442.p3  ORF type:complete len:84 (-),score=8.23 gnl/Chilomastix_caulleri/1442:107-358(-)